MPIDFRVNAVAVEGLKTANGIDNKAQHIVDTQQGAQACQLFLPYFVNAEIRNSSGQTPLHVAAHHAHVEAARMVIGQGADTDA